jgi:hypothetical protein
VLSFCAGQERIGDASIRPDGRSEPLMTKEPTMTHRSTATKLAVLTMVKRSIIGTVVASIAFTLAGATASAGEDYIIFCRPLLGG